MSFNEVVLELPALTIEQRQLLIRRALELGAVPLSPADESLVLSRSKALRDPERSKTALNLADLISHFDQREASDWNSYLDSFTFFLKLHNSPEERFNALTKLWRDETRFISDTNEICGHPAYQQIIGMGILALPFIFRELQREADHWFWALKAISGFDPVPENHRGDIELMRTAWLNWAEDCKGKLAPEWRKAFVRLCS